MSEYELQAIDFLKRSGTTMKIKLVGVVEGFPFDEDSGRKLPHKHYEVTMKRDGKTFTTSFYDSYANFQNHKEPTAYDILASLEKYEVEDNMWDFADEYCYEINSEASYNRVKKIWKSCRDEYRRLCRFFTWHWLPALQEIN